MTPKRTPIEHGTFSGYKKHEKRKDPKCQPCWDARAAYERELRKRPDKKNIYADIQARYWKNCDKEKANEKQRLHYRKNSKKLAEQQRKNRKKNPNYKAVHAANNRRYRARIKNQGFEFYTEKDVIEKYGTICHICNKDIDMNSQRSSKVALELGLEWENGLHLDHVIPISKGGSDTLDNVKPSHAKCNLSKGNRIKK
jgi:5-methylcytosine-specific restriction endonuclease McrA